MPKKARNGKSRSDIISVAFGQGDEKAWEMAQKLAKRRSLSIYIKGFLEMLAYEEAMGQPVRLEDMMQRLYSRVLPTNRSLEDVPIEISTVRASPDEVMDNFLGGFDFELTSGL